MKTSEGKFAVSAMSLAVRSALVAMCMSPALGVAADAANEEVNALIMPTNTVEIGGLYVGGQDSQKFGEYNGLDSSGGYLLGNFNVRGGDAYGMGDGTKRWELYGNDLGTTSRSLGANMSDQGRWNISVDFDQLRHYTTGGTYQTPYQGSMGGNMFTLPSNFGVIARTSATVPGARSLSATQLGYLHDEDVYSERKDTQLKVGYNINSQWDVKFEFGHLTKTGAKLIGAASDVQVAGGTTFYRESPVILMNPTAFQTDTMNLSVNWVGEKANLTVGYFGSAFRDDYSGLSWNNPFASVIGAQTTSPLNTMSTPPGSDLHQLNLSGAYRFSQATKFVGGLSYGRNTQNDSYDGTYTTTPNTVPGLPVNSLDGLVVMTHLDAKLTHQVSNALDVMAAVRYNERDNRTASYQYTFIDLGGGTINAVNTPMSNRRVTAELAADYRLTSKQKLHVGYEHEAIKRWCNNDLANNTVGALPAYNTTPGCAQVPTSKEDRLTLGYKTRLSESIDANAGYIVARRESEVSQFYNPNQGVSDGYENFGFLAWFDASRTENILKAGANFQASDKLSFGVNGRYVWDAYNTALGVQDGHRTSVNLDSTYSISEDSTVSLFVSYQRRDRDMLDNSQRQPGGIGPNLWTNMLKDADDTAGVSAKQNGLLGGKLDLSEEVTYSLAKTHYTTGVLYVNNTVGVKGDTPDIRSETVQFRLAASYKLSNVSKVLMGYSFQHLNSDDYLYNIYQYGYTPNNLLPTNEHTANYVINTIYAAYQYSFR